MSFNRMDVKDQFIPDDERKRLLNIVDNKFNKPKMSRKRFLGTFVSIMVGIFAVYCSLFYVPAFLSLENTLGLSTEDVKLPELETKRRHVLSPYLDKFKLRRGYMSVGQAIEVKYVLSPGDQIEIKVQKCNAPMIIEVFFCFSKDGNEIVVSQQRGTRSFGIRESGFYYFDEKVIANNGGETSNTYTVVWKRNKSHSESVSRQLR